MKLKLTFLLFCMGITIHSFSQQKNPSVIASAGGTSKSATIILEWTLGESFIQTVSSSTQLYTQGFHQPMLEIRRIEPDKDILIAKSTFHVYPNPTTSIINIQLDEVPDKPYSVSLVDVNGKVILKNVFPLNSSLLRIDVSRFTPGTYLLRMSNTNGSVQEVYKVIKASSISPNKIF